MKNLDLKYMLRAIKDVFRKDIVSKVNELIDRKNGVGSGNYRRYVAVVSQSGTDAPTAVVLENTFSQVPAWSYGTVGSYNLTITRAFADATKVMVFITYGNTTLDGGNTYVAVTGSTIVGTADIINFQTNITGAAIANGLLSNTCLELRVYN